jgi:Family of unknown function (DUF6520)
MKKFLIPMLAVILAISGSAFKTTVHTNQAYFWYDADNLTIMNGGAPSEDPPTGCDRTHSTPCAYGFTTTQQSPVNPANAQSTAFKL